MYLDLQDEYRKVRKALQQLTAGNPESLMNTIQALNATQNTLRGVHKPLSKSFDKIIFDYKLDVGYVFLIGSTIKPVSFAK